MELLKFLLFVLVVVVADLVVVLTQNKLVLVVVD
jgi:hypothetical protein